MTYRIVFSEEALGQLKGLDNKTAQRIVDKLQAAKGKPVHFFERLAGREEYKLRAGDYRVIAKITNNDGIVFIIGLGHRKNIYKK